MRGNNSYVPFPKFKAASPGLFVDRADGGPYPHKSLLKTSLRVNPLQVGSPSADGLTKAGSAASYGAPKSRVK